MIEQLVISGRVGTLNISDKGIVSDKNILIKIENNILYIGNKDSVNCSIGDNHGNIIISNSSITINGKSIKELCNSNDNINEGRKTWTFEELDTGSISINKLTISGIAEINEMPASFFKNSLSISISGQGKLNLNNLNLDNLDLKLSGMGNIYLNNSVIQFLNAKISGMGNILGTNNNISKIEKKVSGMGSVNL